MKKIHTFTVRGRGYFPTDMLRYDRAYAASTDDQSLIDELTVSATRTFDQVRRGILFSQQVSIRMAAPNPPTIGRWNSFGWAVEETK